MFHQPINHIKQLIGWLIGRVLWLATHSNFQWIMSQAIFEESEYILHNCYYYIKFNCIFSYCPLKLPFCLFTDTLNDKECNKTKNSSDPMEGEKALKYVMIHRTRPKTCDRVVDLFTLLTKIPEKNERKFLCDR